jgi:hypothetical protein
MLEAMSWMLERMRDEIRKSEKTRYRLFKETGISQGHLSMFLSGQKGLSFEAYETLAEHLGLEIVVRRKLRSRRK